eukprot:2551526-Rhodomonas_salina.4
MSGPCTAYGAIVHVLAVRSLVLTQRIEVLHCRGVSAYSHAMRPPYKGKRICLCATLVLTQRIMLRNVQRGGGGGGEGHNGGPICSAGWRTRGQTLDPRP